MNTTATLVLLVCVFLLLLAAGWWVASRVKHGLDKEPPVGVGTSRKVQVTSSCAASLARLSAEPLLVRREEEDIFVQIGERRVTPLASVPDRGARAAVREAAVAIDTQFGRRWTAVLSVADDGGLTVMRLS